MFIWERYRLLGKMKKRLIEMNNRYLSKLHEMDLLDTKSRDRMLRKTRCIYLITRMLQNEQKRLLGVKAIDLR